MFNYDLPRIREEYIKSFAQAPDTGKFPSKPETRQLFCVLVPDDTGPIISNTIRTSIFSWLASMHLDESGNGNHRKALHIYAFIQFVCDETNKKIFVL
jgi:hypothetical protein